MSDVARWAGNPNSTHQQWSRWTLTVYEGGRRPPFGEVCDNFRRWIRLGFGSSGRVRFARKTIPAMAPNGVAHAEHVLIATLEVEGVPAGDPAYVASLRLQLQQRFVVKGWGALATSTVKVFVLSGDAGDGKPRRQLVVMPTIARG